MFMYLVGYDDAMRGFANTVVADDVSCAVCGMVVVPSQVSCPVCGSAVSVESGFPVFNPSGLSQHVMAVPARSVLAWLITVIDVVCVVLAAGVVGLVAGAAAMSVQNRWSWVWCVIGAVIGLVAGCVMWVGSYRRWGWCVGGMVVGLRCVDPVWFLPTVPFTSGSWPGLAPLLVNVRGGLDPTRLALPMWGGYARRSGQVEVEPEASVRHRGIPSGAVVLTFDTGQVHWFFGSCVVGRNAVPNPGGSVVNLPDLGRVLSASHVGLLESRGVSSAGHVWVEDRATLSGTWLVHDGQETRLEPGQPTEVCMGDSVRLGEYCFQIERAA